MKNYQIPALTGIRAFAAFIVVIHHLFGDSFQSEHINAIIRELNVGVNIFFVLSGFLIWHRYSDTISESKRWFKNYIVNRIARIYPVYFLWTSVVMILGYIATRETLHNFLITYFLNITFLKGFSSEFVYTGISQGWTLTVEELFYLSAPLLILLNIRRRIPLYFLGLFIGIFGFLLFYVFKDLHFFGFFDNWQNVKITTYFGRFAEFFAGIYLAKFLRDSKKFSSKVPITTLLGAIGIILSILIILPFFQTQTEHYSIQTTFGFLYNIMIFPIFVVLLFYGFITESSYLNRFFSSRPLIILGKSSYALYLVHWGMTSYLIHRFVCTNVIVEILITYCLSLLVWKYFEEPANIFIREHFTSK